MATTYEHLSEKFAASEERLFALLDELMQLRRDCRTINYRDANMAARGEEVFDAAETERQIAQALFDDLVARHRTYWGQELAQQMQLARKALVPLVRAWRIAHCALGAGSPHCPSWVQAKIPAMIGEIEAAVSQETSAIPVEPPRSFAIERADDELRC